MKTNIWLTYSGVYLIQSGGIDNMRIWLTEPVRYPVYDSFSDSLLPKEPGKARASKRQINFHYSLGSPQYASKIFLDMVNGHKKNIRVDEEGHHIVFPSRQYNAMDSLINDVTDETRKKEKDKANFFPLPLGWITRSDKWGSLEEGIHTMGLSLVRFVLKNDKATFPDLYAATDYSLYANDPAHYSNLKMEFEVEIGFGKNEYSRTVWITKTMNMNDPFGKKILRCWFENPVFRPEAHLAYFSGGAGKKFSLGDWRNSKGRWTNKSIEVSYFPQELQAYIHEKIKEAAVRDWKQMKLELPFYLKPTIYQLRLFKKK